MENMENREYSKGACGMCEGGCEQCSGMKCGGCGGYNMGCGQMYGMRCGGRHHLLRWVLGVLILAFVFGAGIKMGELRERMTGNYGIMGRSNTGGYNMMQRGNNTPDVYYYRGGMMQGWPEAQQQIPTR